MVMRVHIVVVCCVVLYLSSVSNGAGCPDKLSGIVRWSSWSNKPTSFGATVTVGKNDIILLDESPPFLISHIDVWGILAVDPNVPFLSINVSSVYVQKGGIFYIGSEDCPVSNNILITLVGTPQPGVDPVGLGTKVLGVLEGGTLEIHGKPRTPVWTILSKSANINDTQILLTEDVDWQIGETILIVSTDFEQNLKDDPTLPPTQNELVTITGRPSSNIVAFSPPLRFLHYGKIWTGNNGDSIDMRGEVALMNRNIIVRGDVDSTYSSNSLDTNWGGHIMMRDGAVGRIEYLEVYQLGQKGEFGRYPIHFHNSSFQPNSYVRGNSVHDTFQRCIVVHSTHQLRVQNNFAFRGVGHCYFIEDGNEEQNVFEHNLGVKALVGSLLTADNQPAIFWITNPFNHFYENVAVGGRFGYWFSMPEHPLALSEDQVDTKLRYMPNGDFIGNKAHSTGSGLFIDKGLANAKPGAVDGATTYYPTNWTQTLVLATANGRPFDVSTLSPTALIAKGWRQPSRFIDFIAFKCTEQGMWGRGSYMYAYNTKLADNSIGCIWPGSANLMQNTIIVGETDNIGTFNTAPSWTNWWGDEEGRSRPVFSFINQPVVGYSSYDAGGGDLILDINFYNFNDFTFQVGINAGKVRKTSAITGFTGTGVIAPSNRMYRAKFYSVQNRVYYREYYPWDTDLSNDSDSVKGIVWVDADGSILAGLPEAGCGKQIIGTGPQIRFPGCVKKPDWNAWICPENSAAHRPVYILQNYELNTPDFNLTAVREKYDFHWQRLSDSVTTSDQAEVTSASTYYIVQYTYGTNVVVNQDYSIYMGTGNKFLSNFQAQVLGLYLGEKIRLVFPVPKNVNITVTGGWDATGKVTEVTSTSQLTVNTYYFDRTNGLLWVHAEIDESDIDYDYTYNIPSLNAGSVFNINVKCAKDASQLCTVSPLPANIPSTNLQGTILNQCEVGGVVTGGINSYQQKSADEYVIFNEDLENFWLNNYAGMCQVSTAMAYEGASSYNCLIADYLQLSWARNYSSRNIYVDVTKYTHLQFAIRLETGLGNGLGMGLSVFDPNYATQGNTVLIHSPFYSDDGGPITDQKWTVVRIPLSDLTTANFSLWAIVMQNWNPRFISVYFDSYKLVSLTQTLVPISNFPLPIAKPAQVGPGPEFTYGGGGSTSTTTTGTPAASSAPSIETSLFVFAVALVIALLDMCI